MTSTSKGGKVYDFLEILTSVVGKRKKEGEETTPEDWAEIFKLVNEKDKPCGWRTAVSEWTRVSRRVINDRWGTGDTTIRHPRFCFQAR